jgi:antitoxin Phd
MANMGGMKRRTISKRVSKPIGSPGVERREAARHGRASYTATEAKHEFGRVLEQAIHGTTVVITKHDSPRAVLISMDHFQALQDAPHLKLNTLSDEFDALLERMQTPASRRGMSSAFAASPKRLGKAAVASVRKRG